MNNCPSSWSDRLDAIHFSWAAPQRPNGVLLRYYIQLTRYDNRTVIASASKNENATLSVEWSDANLGKCCSCFFFTFLPAVLLMFLIATEEDYCRVVETFGY